MLPSLRTLCHARVCLSRYALFLISSMDGCGSIPSPRGSGPWHSEYPRNPESRDLVVLVVVTTSAPALHTLRVLLRGSVCVVSLHCCALLWLVVPCWHPLFAMVLLMILLDHLVGRTFPNSPRPALLRSAGGESSG